MSEISRRTLLGATGTAAAATLLTTTAAQAHAAGTTNPVRHPSRTTAEGSTAGMATVTNTVNYEAFVQSDDEGDSVWRAHATFDPTSDPADLWAFIDAAKARLERQNPELRYSGHVRRTDSVVTDLAHP
ncbi:hypothetical protein [Streptomyces sp. SID13588]|uniref:hypothetical protein n=1 Tax=Streptomyces sp. SID13588 TaxID=2706051 RepID=UPI0013CABD7E|nr:hypothetical protein [Streptomyces sp. SID13588]NEA77237.1 hypothetical protein [Streptomyces sp. SID13588]